ncbi:MAG TPA: hypothetical protein VFR18_25110 [Terriglobia bacterium]|nr:hypothetical protein [Terriglobia bacterium]
MIRSVALVHDLTLLTHNTADFQHMAILRMRTKALGFKPGAFALKKQVQLTG